MNASHLVLAEHCLALGQRSGTSPLHFTGICRILQVLQWLVSQSGVSTGILCKHSTKWLRAPHGNQQQQQQHIFSSHLPAAMSVMTWLHVFFFSFKESSACEQGLKRSPSFSTGLLTGGLFLALPDAWGHLSTGAANISANSISGEGGVRVSLHWQKRLHLQEIQKLGYSLQHNSIKMSLLFRRNQHK